MNPVRKKFLRPVLAIAAALGLSACANVETARYDNYDAATRAAPVTAPLEAPVAAPVPASFKVVAVNVVVPRELRANEANRYYPSGDIVWREDPMGDRHKQVDAIVTAAMEQGVSGLEGSREVILDVTMTRFHALTEKARYTVGGVHAIQFNMGLRDALTGQPLGEPRFVKADFEALGGQAAVRAEAHGMTQKVRITNHLSWVIQQELKSPEGFAELNNGIMGAINQL